LPIFDLIAEQKITEAIARGELANLPGEGRPLDLDDDALVHEDLRMAYRILMNAGFVPPEMETVREIGDLERYIETLSERGVRTQALRKLQLLRMRQEASRCVPGALRANPGYLGKLLARLR
jgi:hypothetical protein